MRTQPAVLRTRSRGSALLPCRPATTFFLLLLGGLQLGVQQATGSCVAPPGARQAFIDPTTADALCNTQLCIDGSAEACSATGAAPAPPWLVFSDEFGADSTSVGAARDRVWTAEDMYYSSDYKEWQNYKPENVAVVNGSLRITIENRDTEAVLHAADGDKLVKSNITSGMLHSWNKFCFTGGFIEFGIQLPGDASASGFWAASWLMGNLGRAGYYRSLEGMWPFSYDACEGSRSPPWTNKTGQRTSKCDHPKGRGAPEIDVLEFGLLGKPGTPQSVHTMQMGPVAPPYTSWMLPDASGAIPGISLPGAAGPFATRLGDAFGSMTTPGFPRTGSNITDTFTASSRLVGDSYFTRPHSYGLYWQPGKFVRWYIDGQPLFQIDDQALRPQENAAGERIEQRLISLEPSFIILNLAMAKNGTWADVDWERLRFPAVMSVDYVRVYQPDGGISVGCDPPGFPTGQFISCNRRAYMSDSEQGAWALPLCQDIKSAENSFLLGLGVAVTAVALTCAAMLSGAQSHLRAQSSKAASGGMPLPDVRASVPQSVRQAHCYIHSGQQHLQELLQRTRPDLLAVAREQAAAVRGGGT